MSQSAPRMPVLFVGHGDPMIALRDDAITRELAAQGRAIRQAYGQPRAILAVSAHWYTRGTFVQSAERPEQVYDMYGFPAELYHVKYPVKGFRPLTDAVLAALGDGVAVNDGWGIDHGAWTVLVHLFPEADIPVVQLSLDGTLPPERHYEIGQKLAALREAGYLILGSGNVAHNLRRVDWDNPGGSNETVAFNRAVIDRVTARDDRALVDYRRLPSAAYAVPTPDHYLPLLYCLGAAEQDKATVFNDACMLGSIAMTGFLFA